MFVGNLHKVEIDGVSAIVGTDFKSTVNETVKCSWKDDDG